MKKDFKALKVLVWVLKMVGLLLKFIFKFVVGIFKFMLLFGVLMAADK